MYGKMKSTKMGSATGGLFGPKKAVAKKKAAKKTTIKKMGKK
jgi:hypothetical protein